MIILLTGKEDKNSIFMFVYIFLCLYSLSIYGANITTIKAEVGSCPSIEEVKKALGEKKFKMVTITHVDTS